MHTTIKVKDKTFVPFLHENEIKEKIVELGQQITNDYKGKNPIFLCLLNGAFLFAADLVRTCDLSCEVSFVKYNSYEGMISTSKLIERIGLENSLENRHVIIVEDIIDTGNTMQQLLPKIKAQNPASVEMAILLLKPNAVQFDFDIRYLAFSIPNKFVVGYGLDYDGYGRNLSAIYQLKN